jgi:hypothetical protein
MQLSPIAVLAIIYSKDRGPIAQRSNRNALAAQIDAQDWIEPAHAGGPQMKTKKARAAKKFA